MLRNLSILMEDAHPQILEGEGRSQNTELTMFPTDAALYKAECALITLGKCLDLKARLALGSGHSHKESDANGIPVSVVYSRQSVNGGRHTRMRSRQRSLLNPLFWRMAESQNT